MVGYRVLLSSPGATRLLASTLYARLPLGMTSLAVLLLVRRGTGSFADAGAAVGAYALANAASAPLQGSLVDRWGQMRVLVPSALMQAALFIALIAVVRMHADVGLLVGCTALAGAAAPPLSASARVLWPTLLQDHAQVEAFFALDAVTQEAIWIIGPLLVSLCVALVSPWFAVVVCAAITASGTLLFCSSPASRAWRARGERRQRGGALASLPLRTLLCAIALTGGAWGCLTVAVPARGVELGSSRDAALFLALTAAGSLLGGLGYGRRAWTATLARRYAALLCAIGVAAIPLIGVADAPGVAVLALVLGLAWAPSMSCQYALVQRAAPAGSVTEAFTWQTAAFSGGASAGAALAGLVAQSRSPGSAFALLSCFAIAAAAVALARRHQLEIAVP